MEKQINIILQRVRSTRYGLDGELFINNIKICDTVENTAYCLDEGEYKIELKKCKHHLRHMPVIMIKRQPVCEDCVLAKMKSGNMPMPCRCPQITTGNGLCGHRDGAIIVGEAVCHGVVIHSRAAFDSVYGQIIKYVRREQKVVLTIK